MAESIIKKANQNDGTTIEYNGINFKVPEGFRVFSEDGIKTEIVNRNGDLVGFDTLTYRTVLIKSILKNKDTDDEKIELFFLDTGKTVIVEKSELYSHNRIIKLANKGMQVNSNNSRDWVDFFSKFEALNFEIIPRKETISRLGWIDDKNTTFVPYENNQFELDINESTSSWVNCLKEKGSLIEWVKQMAKLRSNTIFRFVLATSFSAPLLKITGTRSFVIYNWAMSKGGKTATAYCAMSVWGVAESLKVSFDATKVGVEGLSKIFSDLPILIDEKQVDKKQEKVEEMIYMFANGKSKLRGTQNSGVQQNAKWRALAISTGEEPLSSSKSQDGVRSRVLEIYGKPIDIEEEAAELYDFTQKHYGISGKIFIKELIRKNSYNDYQDIIKLHTEIKEEIKVRCPNINFAQLSYIALITVADILIGRMFFKTDKESSLKMAEEIIENISKTKGKDLVDNAYSYISDWILANILKFDVRKIQKDCEGDKIATEIILNDNRVYEKFGLYENSIFYIYPSKFSQKLEQLGFNAEKVKQGFKERGYIVTDDETSTNIKIIYKGEEREFIGLKLSVTDKVNEELIREFEKNNVEVETFYPKIPTMEELGL